MEVAVLVERRVGGDEMHRLAVHAAQERKIVAMIERAVLKVRFGHARASFAFNRTSKHFMAHWNGIYWQRETARLSHDFWFPVANLAD